MGGPEHAVKKGMQGQKRRERRPEKDRGASLGFSSCGLDKSGGSVVEAEPQEPRWPNEWNAGSVPPSQIVRLVQNADTSTLRMK